MLTFLKDSVVTESCLN